MSRRSEGPVTNLAQHNITTRQMELTMNLELRTATIAGLTAIGYVYMGNVDAAKRHARVAARSGCSYLAQAATIRWQ